jgi:hypothetical protein
MFFVGFDLLMENQRQCQPWQLTGTLRLPAAMPIEQSAAGSSDSGSMFYYAEL